MKKVLALIVAAMMLVCCTAAFAWTASITTDDLTAVECESELGATLVIASEVEADLAATIEEELLVLEGIDPELKLDELLPIGAMGYVDGAELIAKFDTVTPYEDGAEVTTFVGNFVGEEHVWTPVDSTVENGKVVVPFNAELLAEVAEAEQSFVAFLSK